MPRTKRQPVRKYRIQYRTGGMWTNGNSFDTRKEAEQYAKQTGRDYQIIVV